MLQVGDKLICIKQVISISSDEVLLDDFEECVIYNIKPTINSTKTISIYNKNNYTFTFSTIKGNTAYVYDYFITLSEYRKLKINKLNESIR